MEESKTNTISHDNIEKLKVCKCCNGNPMDCKNLEGCKCNENCKNLEVCKCCNGNPMHCKNEPCIYLDACYCYVDEFYLNN